MKKRPTTDLDFSANTAADRARLLATLSDPLVASLYELHAQKCEDRPREKKRGRRSAEKENA
jgi:hypothetical protein